MNRMYVRTIDSFQRTLLMTLLKDNNYIIDFPIRTGFRIIIEIDIINKTTDYKIPTTNHPFLTHDEPVKYMEHFDLEIIKKLIKFKPTPNYNPKKISV